jgi:hypothetical protein
MSPSFFAHHESGTTEIEFKYLGLLHYSIGCTTLVAECAHMLLVAEGTAEAVIALGKELSAWGETYGGGRLTHTGVDTKRAGLGRFTADGRFAVGRPPEIEAALEAGPSKPAKKPHSRQSVGNDA